MSETIRVLLYEIHDAAKVLPPIEDVLRRLAGATLAQRQSVCGRTTVRLEDVSEVSDPRFPAAHWRFTMAKARDTNWPGYAQPGAASSDLPLTKGATLLEQTSALYFPHCQRLVLQYNHSGVRISKITDFLTQQAVASITGSAGGAIYQAFPVLDKDVLARYKKNSEVTRVEVVIDRLSQADIARFKGTSIARTLKESVEEKATRFEFSFGVNGRDPNKKLSRSLMRRLMPVMVRRGNDNDKLTVKARSDPAGRLIDLNLLEAAKYQTIKASNVITTQGRRFDMKSMYANLENVCPGWAW